MIREIVKSEKEEDQLFYGDNIGFADFLLVVSIAASVFSAMTELSGIKSDKLAIEFPYLYVPAVLLIIEIVREVLYQLFLNISRIIKQPGWKRVPILIFLLGLATALLFASFHKSSEGINIDVDNKYVVDSSYTVDSSKYRTLCSVCENKWNSDSLAAATKAKSEFGDDLIQQQKAKRAANQRISQINHSTEEWAVKTVKLMSNKAQVAIGNIKDINKQIEIAINDSLSIAKSEYKACLASATDTLLYYAELAKQEHTSIVTTNEDTKDRKVFIQMIILYLSLGMIVFHAAFRQYVYHVSNTIVRYKFNSLDSNKVSWGQKATAIIKVHIHNLGNFFLGLLSLGYELSVNNDELVIKERENKINEIRWYQFFRKRREKKRLERELKHAKEQQALEAQRATIEAEKARIEQETELRKQELEAKRLEQQAKIEAAKLATIKVEQEAKKAAAEAEQKVKLAEIEAKAKQDKLKADNEYKLKLERERAKAEQEKRRLELEEQERQRIAKAEQEKRRLELEEQERQRKLEQERRLKQEQEIKAEQERQRKLEQERVEREKVAKEAAELAEKAEQERLKREQLEQEIRNNLETAKAKNETGKTSQHSVPQQDIEDLFKSCFKNGVLTDKAKLKRNFRNFYKRFQDGTEKLKGVSSPKRKQQIETGLRNNKLKYELTIEKAKQLNHKIYFNKEGRVIIETI